MSVCIVNLGISGLNDQQLDRLLNNAPRNSILLMEDVDAALVKRKAGKAQEGGNNVTLSGILNALDGITAQEGSVVFMTTNHIRKLAPALIRPGRCDRKMLFDYADKHQIEGMFMKFFLSRPPVAPKPARKSSTGSATAPAAPSLDLDSKEKGRKEAYDDMIKCTAAKMAEAITFKDSVTTAQLQGFFMLHRDDPESILGEVPGFLAELAHEREVLSNKKVVRRQRREKKKAKKEEVEKKAKEAKIAAGETVDSSEDEDDEDEDESGSDSFSDSDYYEEAKKPNGLASPKEIKSINGVKAAGGEQEVPAQAEANAAAAV